MKKIRFLVGELILEQTGQVLGQEYFKDKKFFIGDAVMDYSGKYIGLCEDIKIYPSGLEEITIRVRND